MKALLGKMAKGAAALFLVGVALTLVSVPLATAMGSAGLLSAAVVSHVAGQSALWTGVFFGMFGGLAPLAEKAVGALFGGEEKPEQPHIIISIKREQAQAPAIEHEHGADTKHVERLQAQRDEMMRNTTLGTSASI